MHGFSEDISHLLGDLTTGGGGGPGPSPGRTVHHAYWTSSPDTLYAILQFGLSALDEHETISSVAIRRDFFYGLVLGFFEEYIL